MNRQSQSAERRFFALVNMNGPEKNKKLGPCWMWTGCRKSQIERNKNKGPYGRVRFEGKEQLAHRLSWFLETGKWPSPCALHKCDNTLCVRFFHLFEGTKGENNTDRARKGRSGNLKLSKAAVRDIRSSKSTPAELARKYHIDYAHAWRIRAGMNRKEG
jgi:uncharacterized protein YeaC (DUF1315 family)